MPFYERLYQKWKEETGEPGPISKYGIPTAFHEWVALQWESLGYDFDDLMAMKDNSDKCYEIVFDETPKLSEASC